MMFVLGTVYGCGCTEPAVEAKKKSADVVFRGTIVELKNSDRPLTIPTTAVDDTRKIAVFRVIRVWKGEVGEMFEMPAVRETSACIGFWPAYLNVGSELIVYANKMGSEYYTRICGYHKPPVDANDKDVKDLAETPGCPVHQISEEPVVIPRHEPPMNSESLRRSARALH